MNRRFGLAPQNGRRYRSRPGVYAVLWLAGGVLLTWQAEPLPEMQLPGGGIDQGESPLQALHREVLEETGWRIRPVRRLGMYRRFTFMPDYDLWAEKLCAIYLARPIRAYGPPSEAGHTAVWMPAAAAVKALDNDGDRHFLRQVMGFGKATAPKSHAAPALSRGLESDGAPLVSGPRLKAGAARI